MSRKFHKINPTFIFSGTPYTKTLSKGLAHDKYSSSKRESNCRKDVFIETVITF